MVSLMPLDALEATLAPVRAVLETTQAPARPARAPELDDDVDVRRRILPPYKVILHNDDHNSMDHVVRSLMRSVPGIGISAAVKIMLEAHNTGRAVVIVCPLEPAELYRDRLESCGLTATIEPA